MKKRIRTLISGQEKGQSLVILAFSFVGLVALLGLALDLGLVYIERTALKRAIDAAVLSGVTELGNEEDAMLRVIDYLELNDYDLTDSNVYVRGCVRDINDWYTVTGGWCGSAGCAEGDNRWLVNPGAPADSAPGDWYYPYHIMGADEEVRNVFWINTVAYQSVNACTNDPTDDDAPVALGDANKIAITGTVKVDMNFMGLLGWPFFPVTDRAVAQNLDRLDVVVVMDRSGSMQYDPVCFGCWQRTETAAAHESDNPPYSGYYNYPENGEMYPLGLTEGFSSTNRFKVCTTSTYDADGHAHGPDNVYDFSWDDTRYLEGTSRYIIMEAELYSLNPAPVDMELREGGKGYWALQRGEYWSIYNSTGESIDARGAHMAHHAFRHHYTDQGYTAQYGKHYLLSDAQTGNAPWLEYDFRFPDEAGWGGIGTAYIWVRVHGGAGDNSGEGTNKAYYGLIQQNSPIATDAYPATVDNIPDVGSNSSWRWIRIPTGVSINSNDYYRFYFFAGSNGYSIDRIVVTNNPSDWGHNGDGSALGGARTAPATVSSAQRAACDICNEVYGANITDPASQCNFLSLPGPQNNALHPIFTEWENPLRVTKEAIKFFGSRLDPERDQFGFVTYSGSSPIIRKTELACLRQATTQGIDCTSGTNPISYTTVLRDIEAISSGGNTPTASGVVGGMQVLGVGSTDIDCTGAAGSSCSRMGGAQRVLILMTDGVPNSTGGGGWCDTSDAPEWPVPPGGLDANWRCPLYHAEQAAESGIIVYTIALGYGTERDWLKEIAEIGNGQAYFSASGGDLNIIFSQILSNIFVRLIE